MKRYYTAKEVQDMLGIGCQRIAQSLVRSMNAELAAKGYWVERGRFRYPSFMRSIRSYLAIWIGERTMVKLH
ncbi:hypothetical protein SAMN04487895_11088 [Paenibacillus sophorae]|uniref:Uncharacterized protein n=1 Tax=Paenibacillus sophorae TaxID=1333845 RepID=A0A1H8RT43_9BACL|nr:hypothetical protein [Paenibacillus sophorae]SEO69506.1 hypothetical protein SAMN04487895_11088 [Paenibacillus sophorae]